MRAVEYTGAGGPEVIRLAQRPFPEPGENEVLIKVRGAGVNRPDLLQRAGLYPPPSGATDVPGLEVSGVIEGLGTAVWEWAVGDEVAALVSGGGYAEWCVAPAGQLLPVESTLDLLEAAALPETVFTVFTNLFESARLIPGERLLVHGGASGIGTTAIQLASMSGNPVAVTAGDDVRAEKCRALGAELAVNYRTQDFVQAFRDHFGEARPFDVVLDMVGGDYLARNLSLLRRGGRHVNIAFLRGRRAELDLFEVMSQRLWLTGSTLRARSLQDKRRIRDAVRSKVWPWFLSSQLTPVISHRFPLAEVADAQMVLERSEQFGKVVLEVG
ncbi:MAG: NAD(P)H-quinone oxidoreductase [Myxococcota bacterium]